MKKRLTQAEEFDIMKLVLDKFLWLGMGIMAYGFWLMIATAKPIMQGLSITIAGAIVLVLFLIIIVKEYEVVK
ncbi:hypothetical protein D6745_02090 [Candidatus Woesearchaeota archaeon]|nr:MAG: hypothetical protein D6745_02090 [Candidatus Woesearchaeota archaeon]